MDVFVVRSAIGISNECCVIKGVFSETNLCNDCLLQGERRKPFRFLLA